MMDEQFFVKIVHTIEAEVTVLVSAFTFESINAGSLNNDQVERILEGQYVL